MFQVALVLFCSLLFPDCLSAANTEDYKSIYLKSFRCNASEKFVHQNISCFAKSYSRNISILNMNVSMKFPLYNITCFWILYFKYLTTYRQVLFIPKYNVCEIHRLLAKAEVFPNKMVEAYIQMMKASAPDLIHECPYSSFYLRNFSLSIASIPDIFPSGDYKLYGQFAVRDEVFFHMTVVGSVSSTNRDTFG